MLLVDIFQCILWVTLACFVWNHSQAFYYYCCLLGWFTTLMAEYKASDFNRLVDFLDNKSNTEPSRHKKFLFKLVSCTMCSTLWVSLAGSALFGILEWTPVVYFGSLVSLKLLSSILIK